MEPVTALFMSASSVRSAASRASACLRPLLRAEQPVDLPVRRRELPQHADVVRLDTAPEARDRDLGAGLDDVRLVAVADHAARRARLERPTLDLTCFVLHVEVEPGMRVRE